MQQLEKILEEISIKLAGSMGKKREGLLEAQDIIRKHMNDDWTPVEKELPELNESGLSEDVLVSFSDSNSIYIGFYDFKKKRWYVHGPCPYIGRVIAWSPLPESYKPESEKE